jgi:2-phosphosulfolactate phosphatase
MPNLETCLTPRLIDQYEVEGKIVIIVDVFRATSTIASALESGFSEVKPVGELEQALALEAEGYIPAAERNGGLAPGFSHGNSPREYRNREEFQGAKLALSTTNGTQLVALSKGADLILNGALVNRDAIARRLLREKRDCLIFCAGWQGRVNLEDTLFAGALARSLEADYDLADDSTLNSRMIWETARTNLDEYARRASHAKRLSGKGYKEDVAFCLRLDALEVVPELIEGSFRI